MTKFVKGDRVVANCGIYQAKGWIPIAQPAPIPGRFFYFDVPYGSTGTLVRSSSDSGPTYKVILWDFNDQEGEVHKACLNLAVKATLEEIRDDPEAERIWKRKGQKMLEFNDDWFDRKKTFGTQAWKDGVNAIVDQWKAEFSKRLEEMGWTWDEHEAALAAIPHEEEE